MHKPLAPVTLLLALFAMSTDALAGSGRKARFRPSPDPVTDPLMRTESFLGGHPDLRFRLQAQDRLRRGEFEEFFVLFRRAALYADKPSQGMVAEMLWEGRGVPRDRALAYAWMDLAAERGYHDFVVLRERYWAQLDAGERLRAVEEGQNIYARYGDAVAERRLSAALRRSSLNVTGSRTGFVGTVSVFIPGYGTIPAHQYYAPEYWDPKLYRQWHDWVWKEPLRGRVDVGDVERVGRSDPARPPDIGPEGDGPDPAPPP